jgi:hypothetical protein
MGERRVLRKEEEEEEEEEEDGGNLTLNPALHMNDRFYRLPICPTFSTYNRISTNVRNPGSVKPTVKRRVYLRRRSTWWRDPVKPWT